MADSTKIPSRNTELFSSLPESVIVLILDAIHAVYSILAWRQSSKSLLAEILSRMAEADFFEQTHDDFCAALWPYLDKNRRKEKISRWVAKLKADMELSKFKAIEIPKQRVVRTEEGGFKGQATIYRRGHFWKMFAYVQDRSRECDLLLLPINKRRAQIRLFVSEWLCEAGAEKIERAKKTEDIKPAKPSLPCSCACAQCVRCAAKPATASEANGARPAEVRVTKESVETELHALNDAIFECGQKWMNLGLKLDDFNGKVHRDYIDMMQRLAAAVKRANAPMSGLASGAARSAAGKK